MRLRNLPLPERFPFAKIGTGSYGGLQVCRWDDKTSLEIGKFCSFASDVKIMLGGEHRLDWVTTFPFSELSPHGKGIEGHPASRGNVVIGNDVWIGAETMILSGVTIGDGAVVAARSLVTRDIGPYQIFGGTPARFLRDRFDPVTTAKLRAICWWDWPEERIAKAVPLLLGDPEFFFEAVEMGVL